MSGLTRLRAAVSAGPMASRNFRLLTGGQLTSTVGDYCYAVALPWLVLSARDGSAVLGIVLACYGAARLGAMFPGGVLADRLGPRRMMLAADCGRAILAGVLVLIAARHVTALAVLAPIAVVLGAGEGLFMPATMSIMPSLLAADSLAAGNAVNMAVLQAGSVLGPALGGAIVAAAGTAPAFAVDAGSFAVSAVTLALLRAARSGGAPSATGDAGSEPAAGAAPGLREFVRRERVLKLILLVVLAANFGTAGTFEVAAPALAHAQWGAGGYGALLVCIGVGTVAGTVFSVLGGRLRRPAAASGLSLLICGAAIAALPFLGGLPGACAAALLLGAGLGFGNTVLITLVQQWVPAALLGRVMSMVMMCAMGSFPVSVAVTGVLVRTVGPAPFFPIAGALVAAAMLAAVIQPVFRAFGAATGGPATEFAPGI